MATRVITHRFTVKDVLTDPTSVKLSDPDGNYGVKRDDTDAVVVADGTAMTKQSTGIYQYSFTEPADDLEYTAFVEVVHNGATYHQQVDLAAESTAVMAFTYDYLREYVAVHLGWASSGWGTTQSNQLDRILKRGLGWFYRPKRTERDIKVHQWTFMRPYTTLTTSASYSTGTVTIVDGVVTLAGGTFPSWAASGQLTVGGDSYAVSSRDGDTQATLSDTTVDADAGSAYSLERPTYDLPSDFAAMYGPLTYRAGSADCSRAIEITREDILRTMRQLGQWTGRPRYAAIRVKTHDATLGTRWQITFEPAPNAAYEFGYRYRVAPPMLTSGASYPYGGEEHAETLLSACIAAADLMVNDVRGENYAHWMEMLQASIDLDRSAGAPDFLGFSTDRSDNAEEDREVLPITPSTIAKYEGNIYH
jgi:hypothetical protein